MSFNELNSVEHYIIQKLSGVNLNAADPTSSVVKEDAAHQTGLVRANEEFYAWISGDKTMPFGENNRHVPVRLIDFDQLDNNRFVRKAG